MKLSDFNGLFKKSFLKVVEINNPYEDYFTVKMSYPKEMTWIPGEHGIFSIPGANIEGKKWRGFSIASSPQEGFMLLGTRTGDTISSFKKEFLGLKKGDQIKIRGPFGWFKLQKKEKPVVFIAGGVGITPIRSVLTSMSDKEIKAHVIYSSKDFYLFEKDIKQIVNANKNIMLYKISGKKETTEKITAIMDEYNNNAYYYISGSIDFIKSNKNNLVSSGIKSSNIITDPFFGY